MSEPTPIKSSEIILRKLEDTMDVSSFDCGIEELNGFLREIPMLFDLATMQGNIA